MFMKYLRSFFTSKSQPDCRRSDAVPQLVSSGLRLDSAGAKSQTTIHEISTPVLQSIRRGSQRVDGPTWSPTREHILTMSSTRRSGWRHEIKALLVLMPLHLSPVIGSDLPLPSTWILLESTPWVTRWFLTALARLSERLLLYSTEPMRSV